MLTLLNSVRAQPLNHSVWVSVAILGAALVLSSCAALQPPSATGPTGSVAPYPILFTEDSHRQEAIAVALKRLAVSTDSATAGEAQLQPVTGALLNFSPNATRNVYLPKLGTSAVMSEEEIRESLRRFIKEWQELIGADPVKLSLVERTDQPDGSKLAIYEQRPFRYPIRGNYGKLQIHFAADRRLLNLSSTCIPDAERIQTALTALTVRVKAEDAVQQLRQATIYSDRAGTQLNFKLPTNAAINPLGLVTYILPQKDKPEALEFHLAWELELTNSPITRAYVDAVNGDLIATR